MRHLHIAYDTDPCHRHPPLPLFTCRRGLNHYNLLVTSVPSRSGDQHADHVQRHLNFEGIVRFPICPRPPYNHRHSSFGSCRAWIESRVSSARDQSMSLFRAGQKEMMRVHRMERKAERKMGRLQHPFHGSNTPSFSCSGLRCYGPGNLRPSSWTGHDTDRSSGTCF